MWLRAGWRISNHLRGKSHLLIGIFVAVTAVSKLFAVFHFLFLVSEPLKFHSVVLETNILKKQPLRNLDINDFFSILQMLMR